MFHDEYGSHVGKRPVVLRGGRQLADAEYDHRYAANTVRPSEQQAQGVRSVEVADLPAEVVARVGQPGHQGGQ